VVFGHSLLWAYVAKHIQLLLVFPRMLSSYQVVLWKQGSFLSNARWSRLSNMPRRRVRCMLPTMRMKPYVLIGAA